MNEKLKIAGLALTLYFQEQLNQEFRVGKENVLVLQKYFNTRKVRYKHIYKLIDKVKIIDGKFVIKLGNGIFKMECNNNFEFNFKGGEVEVMPITFKSRSK